MSKPFPRPKILILSIALAALVPPTVLLVRDRDTLAGPVEDVAETYIPPKGYVCYRAAAPLVIDGNLDKPGWQAAPWTDDFVDIQGDLKPRPRYRTRVKMLWDDEFFYIGAELQEPHVWATLKKHDSIIFQDNDFEVFIDPNGDNHEYYEFEINALDTGFDLFLPKPYKDGGQALINWEIPGLKTAVHIDGTLNNPHDTDRGWTVEIAMPWKALEEQAHRPSPPADGDQWRVNFSRVEWQHRIVNGDYEKVPDTREDNWVWSPQGVVNMHRPETWGYIQFSKAPPGSAQFIADPTGPARYALHRIYYAEIAYRDKHNRWGTSLSEIGLPRLTHSSFIGEPKLMANDGTFEATIDIGGTDGKTRRLHIRDDARIWDELR